MNEFEYNQYLETLLNIARLTNKENSILISFVVNEDKCMNKVSYLQRNGTKDELKNEEFPYDETFQNLLLEKLVIKYCDNMSIALQDNIDIDKDGKYTYRIITEDNDMLTIDGITLEYAKKLMSLTKNKKVIA